ncbi:MAG: HDOD domain-containing protein [Spirochaetes bacterium]|nr:HDOD domain-containing protein [Spirochaetota bacterium]
MEYFPLFQLSNQEIVEHFLDHEHIRFSCYRLDFKEEEYLAGALKACLTEIGKELLFDYLNFIYRELLNNAKKANIKRVYFEDLDLDILTEEEYQKGMKGFKTISPEKMEEYMVIQEKKDYYIQSDLYCAENEIVLTIRNNVEILDKELEMIQKKKKNARVFKTVEQAIEMVMENPEGAGLGIIITILMLKKLGLSGNEFMIFKQDGHTISQLTIPLSIITLEQREEINELLQQEIQDIPQFPDHIVLLQEKLNDPEVNLKEVSNIISRDPSLTGEIIKIANSAYLSSSHKIVSVIDAIKIIGLRGLKNIIYSYGTKLVFQDRYDLSRMADIFKHSYNVAFLSFLIAKYFNLKNTYDYIYVAGILHDLGKIIATGINPDLIENINHLCHEKGISIKIIEELTSGYNHQVVGALLAKKWQFPDDLVAGIQYHHYPLDCDEEHQDCVFVIYLANLIAHDEVPPLTVYHELYDDVLKYFKFTTPEKFETFYKMVHDKLQIHLQSVEVI